MRNHGHQKVDGCCVKCMAAWPCGFVLGHQAALNEVVHVLNPFSGGATLWSINPDVHEAAIARHEERFQKTS